MFERVTSAIERKKVQVEETGQDYPHVPVPINGKVIEPLVGRMYPVSSVVPATLKQRQNQPTPDPTRKNVRAHPSDQYSASRNHGDVSIKPGPEPHTRNTLTLVCEAQTMVMVGLRQDMEAKLRKRHDKDPYVAKLGMAVVDPYTKTVSAKWEYRFVNGVDQMMPAEHAIGMLRHPMHGQWLEEKPQGLPPKEEPKKPRKRRTYKRKTTTKSEAEATVEG